MVVIGFDLPIGGGAKGHPSALGRWNFTGEVLL